MSTRESRWERQWALYHRAAELPPAEADDLLARECAEDPELLEEVRSLLAVEPSGFLSSPAATGLDAGEPLPADLDAGDQVGPYRIVGVLGEGGMGTVYRAEQEEPLARSVALKVIRPGMDTLAVVRRFEAERRALALLEHPGIAQVFDAGVTEQGRPYFVMERVDGEPIDRYCDGKQLDLDRRIALFLEVCSAVQHAHQKGIVHRDLKPSNILVTTRDDDPREPERPLVKVIDFGIAKFLDAGAEGTSLTVAGQIVGTPDTMAPEQVAPGGLATDSRTDVFGLGFVLYELLTGTPPFPAIDRRRSSWSQIEAAIRTREAAAPALRLAQLSVERRQVLAAGRGLTPSALSRRLGGDLTWILLKALRPEPDQRYASVSELAADLVRFRSHLPVEAGPPSLGYRARKLIRRHRVAATVGLLFVFVIGGFGVALVQRTLALQQALGAAETAREDAQAQGRRAEGVSGFLVGLLQRANADETGAATPTVRDALLLGLAQLRADDALEDETRLELLVTIARSLRSQSDYAAAAEALEEALGVVERTEPGSGNHAIVLLDLAVLGELQGEYSEAADRLVRALEMLRAEGPARDYDVANTQLRLGAIWRRLARFAEAEEELREAQATFERLGTERALSRLGTLIGTRAGVAKDRADNLTAIALYERALEERRAQGEDSLSFSIGLNNLATAYLQQGDTARAGEAFRRAAAISEALLDADHPRRLSTAQNLASVAALEGSPEAERLLREALGGRLAALGPDHPDVAGSRLALGELLLEHGRPAEAALLLREAAEALAARLGEQHPTLARARTALGALRLQLGDVGGARAAIEPAIDALNVVHPEGSEMRIEALRWHGELHLAEGDREAAETVLRQALSLAQERLAAGQLVDPWPRIRVEASLARCLRAQGRAEDGRIVSERVLQEAVARWPTDAARLETLRALLRPSS